MKADIFDGNFAYHGRFAPSPTGLLHAGSLVAALASWLDARTHGGRWTVRIEDVDTPRCVPGADRAILQQLHACGLVPDAPPVWQSQRSDAYAASLQNLIERSLAYRCTCSRAQIAAALAAQGAVRERHHAAVYPGTCRDHPPADDGRPAAWRLNVGAVLSDKRAKIATKMIAIFAPDGAVHWHDRRLGAQSQNVLAEVGDFVLRRADGLWAYQLAVVVDDAAEGITHVVRGEDLADNTPRQMALQRALRLPTPVYLHTPLVNAADGQKLSKQNGAMPVDVGDPVAALAALNAAAAVLGLPLAAASTSLDAALRDWTAAWAQVPTL